METNRMHHLIPVFCLLALTFGLLARRYSLEIGYLSLSCLPPAFFLITPFLNTRTNFDQITHRVLHIAYDSSYILVLFGLLLVLQATFRKQRKRFFLITTFLAGLPLAHI